MGKEAELIGMLRDNGMTIACAESLTGGLVSGTLVSVPGASYAFMEGFVTYDIGAISPVTAREMAIGAAKKAGTDMALATTGNAGPDPSEGKPVGLVYTAVYIKGNVQVYEHMLKGSRPEIREQTVNAVIEEAWHLLSEQTER